MENSLWWKDLRKRCFKSRVFSSSQTTGMYEDRLPCVIIPVLYLHAEMVQEAFPAGRSFEEVVDFRL